MQFEPHQFDEQKNPNIPHDNNQLKELRQMLLYVSVLVVVIWLSLEVMTKILPYAISLQREQTWFGSIIEQTIVSNDNHRQDSKLQQLADELAKQMRLPENLVRVHIHKDTTIINAYATLGGHIVLYQGLLDVLPDEQSVAAVLAHEIAHVKHRDPLRATSRSLLLSVVISTISGNDGLINLASMSDELRYSRALENSADEAAIHAIAERYGGVDGMLKLFRVFEQQEQTAHQQLSWLSSHPSTESRIQHVYQLAEKHHYAIQHDTYLE